MGYKYSTTPPQPGAFTGTENLFSGLTTSLLVVFGIILLMFFIGRVIVLWYLKINKMVSLLEQIAKNTSKGDEANPVTEKKEGEVIKEIEIF